MESQNWNSCRTIRPLDVFVVRALVVKQIEPESATEENLIACLEVRTAGDPDEEDLVFTNLTARELSGSLNSDVSQLAHF